MNEHADPAAKLESMDQPPAPEQDWRQRLLKANLSLPTDRVRSTKKAAPTRTVTAAPVVAQQTHSGGAEYLSVKGTLHAQLLDELDRRNLLAASEETLTEFVQTFVDEALRIEDLPLNEDERRRLVGDLLEETLGVGPLASLMADPAVTDILVNRPDQVYVERFGRLEKTDVRFRDVDHLVRIIQRIAARVGRRIDESSPMVDARLPDGSRVNATLPPVTLDSPTLSIRRFGRQRLRRTDLMQLGMFSQEIHDFLDAVVRGRKNVLISGGTGSGKSTMLGALAEAIPDRERVVTVEDSAELILDQEHVVRMETRPANIEGKGLITARDLVVNALRMRPDRIIVGEVRSGEALDMLQAMNTGHDGGLTTVHANSPRDAFARLETMVLMAGLELPSRAIREQIVSALHLIVHVRRFEDGVRRIESIAEIVGMEGTMPQLQDIFRFERHGLRGRQIAGEFVATGIVPRVVEELHERGIEVNRNMFQKSKPGVHPPGHATARGWGNNYWKSEIRNPKQIGNPKEENTIQNMRFLAFEYLAFEICFGFRVSDFEFRISDFHRSLLNHD